MRVSAQELFNRDYSVYKDKLNIPSVQEEANKVSSENQSSYVGVSAEKENSISPIRERLDTNEVIDYASKKDLATDKELIGTTSDIESLDMEKAISTMQKDKLLSQYNFFVSDVNQEDGFMVRRPANK